ncbi:MAG: Nif3-like dinuclear metal center hexameric protein [Bacteroidota bacterium]|nr:Nif3-like dinuclear metal center hexameric protein [Bacteroidota bacterium]MDP4231247.1 Nif3-like dinuclear metal center hexameric protein [Bacteroidota bacterium]MDP4235368.1 Nif3-like dinuclear metal center hexameric protein [Bacteroidota bacterium]
MKIAEFIKAFNGVIPLAATGYAKDAVGLQVGFEQNAELQRLLVAYEITDEVIDEALSINANLILCYHPLIFPNISAVTDSTRTGALLRRLIKNEIALYVIHTAFDTDPEFGTNRLMADALGLTKIRALMPLDDLLEKIVVFVPRGDVAKVQEAMWEAGAGNIGNYDECSFAGEGTGTFRGNSDSNPAIGKPLVLESVDEVRLEMICEHWKSAAVISQMIAAHPYEEVAYDRYRLKNTHPKFGMGCIGEWADAKEMNETLESVSNTFHTSVLRHNGVTKDRYSRVAVLGGAGMEYYSAAKRQGADLFITADIRYHEFYRAEHDNMLLIDAGHAETEQFVAQGMLKAALEAYNVVNLHNPWKQSIPVVAVARPNVVRYYQK